jgi:DNA-binding transcriptional ArsR family regulator
MSSLLALKSRNLRPYTLRNACATRDSAQKKRRRPHRSATGRYLGYLTSGPHFDDYRTMETNAAVRALGALAQPSRLAVFRLLVRQGPSGVAAGEIAAELDISPATLSFHLKELSQAGLVSARQDGRFIYYAADFAAMNRLLAFLTENCCAGDCGPGQSCKPSRSTRGTGSAARTRKGVKA